MEVHIHQDSIRLSEFLKKNNLKVSPSTAWKLKKRPDFPTALRLSSRLYLYSEKDLQEFFKKRMV